jgi:hypothetical protein
LDRKAEEYCIKKVRGLAKYWVKNKSVKFRI